MPGSVLTVGMLPDVLIRERTSVQPTSVRVRLMTGNKYTVEHRNFENWSSKDESCWRSERGSLLNSETVAFQLDSSEQGYFPDPSSLRGGSGNET